MKLRTVLLVLLVAVTGRATYLEAGSTGGSTAKIYAVGDIANCSPHNADLIIASSLDAEELAEHELSGTEALPSSSLKVEELIEHGNGIVLALGDLAYPAGTAEEFKDCFEKVWNTLIPRTYPIPGNHEYKSGDALPYKEYFREKRGIDKTYYNLEYADWHLIAMDSEIDASAESEQMQWLENVLAGINGKCVLAFFHKPAITSQPRSKSENAAELYRAVSAAGGSIVLNGHNHFYERSAVLNGMNPSSTQLGTRSFTVGTGGSIQVGDPVVPGPYSEKIIQSAAGVLELELKHDSYAWRFISVNGAKVLDSGTAPCRAISKLKS